METIKLNITQLNTLVKRIIDAEEFLQTIAVYGEVSNFKISAGNAYFDIKEENAQLACIKFGVLDIDIHNGDKVLLTGRLNYYVKTGKLSFIANKIEPYGLGDLYKKYIELKEKLSQEGLFDERHKKQLPRFTNKVGVVTSETGAVIRDICHVAQKKNPYTDIVVYPAKVQGVGAEDEIIAGLRYFEDTNVDVVILARGGGSFEDMAPFNTEKLVREIFACKKPIISAVGHETDFSLSDFAADMRAPTPSVAASIAFFDYNSTLQQIGQYIADIINSTHNFVAQKQDQITDIMQLITSQITSIKDQNTIALNQTISQVISTMENNVNKLQSEAEKIILEIEKANPLHILKTGYLWAEKNNQRITTINQLDVGDQLLLKFADGKAKATIIKKEN